MSDVRTLLTGIAFGESPRWHEGRIWFCDWGTGEIIAASTDGKSEVVGQAPGMPFCIDPLPDGRMMVCAGSEGELLRLQPDGSLVEHAALGDGYWNEVTVAPSGDIYVNDIGFEFPEGEFKPGRVCVVRPGGEVREVAGGFAFPNGMALTDDGRMLIVAESYAGRLSALDIEPDGGLSNRRPWAEIEGAAPDGISVDASGAIWFADVPNQNCVRVREGGEVLETIPFDRGCFSCALGGDDGRTLFVTAAKWGDEPSDERTGVLYAVDVDVPARNF